MFQHSYTRVTTGHHFWCCLLACKAYNGSLDRLPLYHSQGLTTTRGKSEAVGAVMVKSSKYGWKEYQTCFRSLKSPLKFPSISWFYQWSVEGFQRHPGEHVMPWGRAPICWVSSTGARHSHSHGFKAHLRFSARWRCRSQIGQRRLRQWLTCLGRGEGERFQSRIT